MLTQAFYTGISGLQNNSIGIDILSNNIANINTVGYRGYTTDFASMYENSISTSGNVNDSIGNGVLIQSSSMVRDQGSLAISERSTDLAIEGNGWFGVKSQGNAIYTRDGNFNFDTNGDLVTVDGFHVLGTVGGNISNEGVLTSAKDEVKLGGVNSQESLNFPKTLTFPPEPTTNSKFLINLGVNDEPITIGSTIIDSNNKQNNLRLEFTKDPVQVLPGSQYSVTATVQSPDGSIVYDTKTGTVEFDASGALTLSTLSTIDNNGSLVNIDLGNGFDGITASNAPVTSGSSISNGTIGGELEGYSINKNAEVIATFSNGRQSSVGKIAVYHFVNEQGLGRINGTRFEENSNSGQAIFYTDANGDNINGTPVVNYRLENSNVLLSSGLTDLIILQRSYDANAKSITTADEMMKKALDMDA